MSLGSKAMLKEMGQTDVQQASVYRCQNGRPDALRRCLLACPKIDSPSLRGDLVAIAPAWPLSRKADWQAGSSDRCETCRISRSARNAGLAWRRNVAFNDARRCAERQWLSYLTAPFVNLKTSPVGAALARAQMEIDFQCAPGWPFGDA